MNNDNAVALALIAIVGSVITALFKLLNNNTKAIKSLDEGSRERNGHLGELVERGRTESLEGISKVLAHLDTQHVSKQTVDKQIVHDRREK